MADQGTQEPPINPLDNWRQFITDSERQWNAFFKDVLGTDGFSSAMNTWVEASLTVQRMIADQLERYYAAFNIPTHSDLVALGERMRAIEEALARVETHVSAPSSNGRGARSKPAKATGRRAPKRTRKPPAAAVSANGTAR